MSDEIPLERGLCWYYENIREMEKRKLPTDKRFALAYEAGRHDMRIDLKQRVLNSIKLPNIEWP